MDHDIRLQEEIRSMPWEVDSPQFSDAYVAGFLDGDGSIVATVSRQPKKYRFPWRIYLKINFTQHVRHKLMLDHLKDFLDSYGNVRVVKSHDLAELVIVDRRQIKEVLRRLLPHLVLKREQAGLVLRIISIYDGSAISKNGKSFLSEGERSEIFSLVARIRNLNSGTGGKRSLDYLTL